MRALIKALDPPTNSKARPRIRRPLWFLIWPLCPCRWLATPASMATRKRPNRPSQPPPFQWLLLIILVSSLVTLVDIRSVETTVTITHGQRAGRCCHTHHIGAENSLLSSSHSCDVMTTFARQMLCQRQNNGLSTRRTHSPCVKQLGFTG